MVSAAMGCATMPAPRNGPACIHEGVHHGRFYWRANRPEIQALRELTIADPDAHELAEHAADLDKVSFRAAFGGGVSLIPGVLTTVISAADKNKLGTIAGSLMFGASVGLIVTGFALLPAASRAERKAVDHYNAWAAEHGCPP